MLKLKEDAQVQLIVQPVVVVQDVHTALIEVLVEFVVVLHHIVLILHQKPKKNLKLQLIITNPLKKQKYIMKMNSLQFMQKQLT